MRVFNLSSNLMSEILSADNISRDKVESLFFIRKHVKVKRWGFSYVGP